MEDILTEAEAVAISMENTATRIPELLLPWFDESKRILPWRSEPTPYRVWVSEIMLQQTRVEAVKAYFERFMKALPTVEALAECEEEKLLKLWEGLGYYNRVRNLQKAAKQMVESGELVFPEDFQTLQKLPGIGSYTAGAISSIAFGRCAPAVDGNVLRVLSRVLLFEEDVLSQKAKRKMEELVLSIIPKERPGDFNQALMELGAMVCIPNGEPHCTECPLQGICGAYKNNRIQDLPVKVKKIKRKTQEKTVLLLLSEKKVALRKRESKGLLAGMYEFPNLEGHLSKEEVLDWVKEQGMEVVHIEPLEDAKHIFSHVEWHMKAYALLLSGWQEIAKDKNDLLFVEPEETRNQYPIPAAFLAYTRYMNMEIGYEEAKRQHKEEIHV